MRSKKMDVVVITECGKIFIGQSGGGASGVHVPGVGTFHPVR
jgi:hypothetical protein